MVRRAHRIVMTVAGSLLIIASLLKAQELLNVYIPSWKEKGVWESWEFFLFQIPAEFALGVWMVSGIFPKLAWLAGSGAYLAFVIITLSKALAGQASCGCFGQIQVNPWITLLAIDVPLAVCLLIFRPKEGRFLPPPWPPVGKAIATAAPIFVAMLFAAPLLVALRPEFIKPQDWQTTAPMPTQALSPTVPSNQSTPQPPQSTISASPSESQPPAEQPADNSAQIVPPKPDEQAKPSPAAPLWPWLEHIDIADQLKDGLVIVFLYHHDCSTCAESIPVYEKYYLKTVQEEQKEFELAFVAIPPYGKGPLSEQTIGLRGKLSDKQKWAIQSPLIVALLDGRVVKQWPQGTAPSPDTLIDQIFQTH